MAQRPARVPGDEPPAKPGITELNNTNADPNTVARDREKLIQSAAVAATGGEGAIAPGPAIDSGPAMREVTLHGKRVIVRSSPGKRDPLSAVYGPESKLPSGTPVNKDGTVFDGVGQAYGYIGDLQTDVGWLVGRIIPYEQADGAKKAG